MKAAPDARQYEPSQAIAGTALPPKVDLRPHMPRILNQSDTNSCVAHAVAGTYDYWVKRLKGTDLEVSRLFVYYNARWRDNCQDKDEGATIQFAVDSLGEFGACPEVTWPFRQKFVNTKPPQDAYKEGVLFRVKTKHQVPTDLMKWKQSLAQGLPIVFGCLLFDSFDDCTDRGGVVPMPSPEDLGRKEHGSHAMCAVGYSDVEKVFIVRNSWGPKWGDQGYCYMPYNYLMSDKLNDGDCWVFQPDKDIPDHVQQQIATGPQQTSWSYDNAPVTNGGQGVDFEINPHTVEDYAKLAVNLFEELTHEWHDNKSPDYQTHSANVAQGIFGALAEIAVGALNQLAESASAASSAPKQSAEADEDEASSAAANSDADEALSAADDSDADEGSSAADDSDADEGSSAADDSDTDEGSSGGDDSDDDDKK